MSGYTFELANAVISWSSKKKQIVAPSTTVSEYMALSHATQEPLWRRMIAEELNIIGTGEALPFYSGCKSASDLTRNSVHHAQTKHRRTASFYLKFRKKW